MNATFPTFRVLVVSPLSTDAGRKKLNGIHRFLSEGYDWEIELVRNETAFTADLLRGAERKYDGVFIGWAESPDICRVHADLAIPSVFFDSDAAPAVLSRNPSAVFVHDDARAIARTAARHFVSQGRCVAYGYVPTRQDVFWSSARGSAFRTEMRRRGARVEIFDHTHGTRLEDWLVALPKPAGVFCAFDDRAADVLLACRRAKLAVPDDVAVLGVNNDEVICEHTRPRLSSVAVDFTEQGRRAARELHALMLHRRPAPRNFELAVGAADVCERASTRCESTAGALVQRALAYIEENAPKGISPADVTRHVRVSRRLLDLRFREVTGTTLQNAIRTRRLDRVKQLLATTRRSIGEIALDCGYVDANYLKNQFRRAFGVSMRDWRRQNGQ